MRVSLKMYTWKEILNAHRSVTPAWMGWKLDRNSVHACIGSGPTPFYKLYLKASFELPEQFTSHVGQVTNWAKEGLKSRHCYCTVYNQGQRECSGEHAREAMPSESCALAAGFLLFFWNRLRHNLLKCNSSVFFLRKLFSDLLTLNTSPNSFTAPLHSLHPDFVESSWLFQLKLEESPMPWNARLLPSWSVAQSLVT